MLRAQIWNARDVDTNPAANLTAPPDWWAKAAETSFFADDVGLYRLLDADATAGPRHIRAVRDRLFRLNHAERRLAQLRLRTMLREIGAPFGPRHLWIAMLIAYLLARAAGGIGDWPWRRDT